MVEASRIVIGVYALLIMAYATAFIRQRYNKRKALEMKLELDTMSSAYYTVHRELSSVNDGLESVIGDGDPVHDRLAAPYCNRHRRENAEQIGWRERQ